MPDSPLAVLVLGFVLGLRHALDVDHVAAVSTIVSERRSVWASSLVGAVWGLGHTTALLALGVVVVALQTAIPPAVAHGLELAVAVMLVALGARLLWTLRTGGRLHLHGHVHDGRFHVHPHVHGAHPRPDGHAAGPDHHAHPGAKPFLVGLVHGLAGSAGLMLVVLATIPSRPLALAYIAVFGCGSIGGMMAMSAVLALPFALAAARLRRFDGVLVASAAVASVAVGLALAWRIGVEAGVLA
jgi:hypothetical protein